VVDVVRTWLFRLLFAIGSLIVVIIIPFVALFGPRAMIPYAHGWARYHTFIARWVMGVRAHFEGAALPPGPVLFAAKHEAMFETLEPGTTIVVDGVPSHPRLTQLLNEYHKLLLRRALLWWEKWRG